MSGGADVGLLRADTLIHFARSASRGTRADGA
jgi:hypothetical protein